MKVPDDQASAPDNHRPELGVVTRAVVWNQALWTAGYALTTGGFFNYFSRELGAGDRMLALLLVIPETVGILALATRPIVRRAGHRKTVWIGCSLFARLVSIGIPLLAFSALRPTGEAALWTLAACLAASQAAGGVAYIALLSWLADLVPGDHWGRFFARQQIADFSVLIVVPIAGGYAVDWWWKHATPDALLLVYVVAFALGIALQLASMIPLLRLPHVSRRSAAGSSAVAIRSSPDWTTIVASFRNRSLRFLLIHNWWLAAFNGMTQAVIFSYVSKNGPLNLTLGTYQVLSTIQRSVSIPVSWGSGWWADRRGNKGLLIVGVLIAGGASMPFWLAASPGQWWWVIGAYVLWGFWPAANITGRNLVLKLSPRGDNTTQLALFRQVGGLLAGLSGLLGGVWLASLKAADFAVDLPGYRIESYQLLFLISLLGRLTSTLWLLPIREPQTSEGRLT